MYTIYYRDTCSACTTLAPIFNREYNTVNKTYTKNIKQNKLAIRNVIEGTCNKIGYVHQPYVWLEEYCDEITEDAAGRFEHYIICSLNNYLVV